MLTAQRKAIAGAQRKASVPQPAAPKARGAVVANANLGDAAKGVTSAALAAALLLGGAPQPAHAEFNKQAVENLNRSGAEVSKTIQENTPDLPSITGGVVNKTINKVKESLGVEDNSSNLKTTSDKGASFSGFSGIQDSSAQDNLKRASNKANEYNPLTSGNSQVQTGEKISAEGGKFTGLFQADTSADNTAERKVNQNQLLKNGTSMLPAPSPIADLAALDAQDVKNAGRDLKNAAGRAADRAADSVGAAGAAAKDYSAELRRVGIEAKRGDGLTGAFRKANNGKIDITKGTYNSIEDAASDAQRGLDRAGSAAQRGLDRATNKAGDVLNVRSNPIDSVKRAADKAADKAKDLVSQAPTGWTYLGDIADAGQDIKRADRKTRDSLVGGANDDRSAELRQVGINAKRGDGLTGAFFNKANNGKIDITRGGYDSVEDAGRDAKANLQRVGDKANDSLGGLKRAADKAADKAKDLVSQAPIGYSVLGDIADAGQDLKNAAGRAADNIGAAGAAANDRSAELRQVGVEAKRGDGLTGAFRKADNGKIDITKGGPDADDLVRAADKAASNAKSAAKDLVSMAPQPLGDIADLPFAKQPADKSNADGGLKGVSDITSSAKEVLDPSSKSPRLQNVQQDGSTVTRLTVNPTAGGFDKVNDARRDASRDPTKNDQRLEGVRGATQQLRDNVLEQSKTNALGASTVKGAVESVKDTLREAAGGLAGGAENAKVRLQDAAEAKGKLNPAAVAGREGGNQLSVSDAKNEREALRGAEDTREAGRKAAEGPLGIFKRG